MLLGGAACSSLPVGQAASQSQTDNPDENELYLPTILSTPKAPELLETIPLNQNPKQVLVNAKLNKVYVLGGNYVLVLQGTELVDRIALGGFDTRQMVLDEERDIIYVPHDLSDSEEKVITVIHNGEVEVQIPLPDVKVIDMAIHPETHDLYLSGMTRDGYDYVYSELIVIRDNEIVSRLNIDRNVPDHLVIDSVNDYIYVAGTAAHPEIEFEIIGVIKVVQENEVIDTLTIGQGVLDMALDENTGDVLVINGANYNNEEGFPGTRLEDAAILDKGEIVHTQNVGGQGNVVHFHIVPHPLIPGFFYIDAGDKILAGQRSEEQLEVIAEIEVGRPGQNPPYAFDPNTGNFYRANYQDDSVSVIQGTENIATIPVGYHPMGIAVNPNDGWVYVANNDGASVSVLAYPESLDED